MLDIKAELESAGYTIHVGHIHISTYENMVKYVVIKANIATPTIFIEDNGKLLMGFEESPSRKTRGYCFECSDRLNGAILGWGPTEAEALANAYNYWVLEAVA